MAEQNHSPHDWEAKTEEEEGADLPVVLAREFLMTKELLQIFIFHHLPVALGTGYHGPLGDIPGPNYSTSFTVHHDFLCVITVFLNMNISEVKFSYEYATLGYHCPNI